MSDLGGQLPLFVYGTLRSGQKNAWLLRGKIVAETAATIGGMTLYALPDYPMLIEEQSNGPVYGELITLDAVRYEKILAELDEFEGCGPGEDYLFKREARSVKVGDGECMAWVYLGNPRRLVDVPSSRIVDGDWCWFAAKEYQGT